MEIDNAILTKEAEGDFFLRMDIYVNNQWGRFEGHIRNLSNESVKELVQEIKQLFTQHLARAPDNKEAFKDFMNNRRRRE